LQINRLYISNLDWIFYSQLFPLFSVIWFFLGTFLFLICFSISIFIRTFVVEETNKKTQYATKKATQKSKGANSSSDERSGRWQQEFVPGYIPQWQADV